MASPSFIVIKVKYGDTLRRFNVNLNGDLQLDTNIDGLKAKISNLFNFESDAEMILTYIDEDQDVVALVDDNDLQDVARQALNPLRINVQLNNGKKGSPSIPSSSTSTPRRSQVNGSNPNINSGVSDLLKAVPEPFREALAMVSLEMASKAASSAPVFAELIDCFTKMGQAVLDSRLQNQSAPADVTVSKQTGEGGSESTPALAASAPEGSHINISGSTPASGSTQQPVLSEEASKSYKSNGEKKTQALHSGAGTSGGVPCYPPPFVISTESDCRSKGAASAEQSQESGLKKFNPSARPYLPTIIRPFFSPTLRSGSCTDNMGGHGTIFHRGVRCDGCGVLPITGPRFKSKVKDDYDLCQICFAQIGNDSDYTRFDFPALHRHPWSFKGFSDDRFQRACRPVHHRGQNMKSIRPKLDSCFMLDVNVIDGTIMAPKTPFTKIWRLRNCGTIPWTHGTQLVWIGGDNFAHTDSVQIEMTSTGIGAEEELDVAVDFIAPENPGQYISYWRMASPSGQKFGQRVWVLIQVDPSLTDMEPGVPNMGAQTLNLNLPSESGNQNSQPESAVDNNVPLVDVKFEADNNSGPPPPPVLISDGTNATSVMEGQPQNNLSGPTFLPFNWVNNPIHTPDGSRPSLGPQPPTLSQNSSSLPNPSEPRVSSISLADAWTAFSGPEKPAIAQATDSQPTSLEQRIPSFSPSNAWASLGPEQTGFAPPTPLEGRIPITSPANAWTISYPAIEADLLGFAPSPANSSSTAPSYPTINSSTAPSYPTINSNPVAVTAPTSQAEMQARDGGNNGDGNKNNNNEMEEALVKGLVEMGFHRVDLNREVLRKNGYDMQKALDDLCAYADWDLLLDELHGMGFGDEEMNRKALVKNNGSLKHAVMDLISQERA